MVFMKRVVCFISPNLWRKFISDYVYHMLSIYQYFMKTVCIFRTFARNRTEAPCFTKRYNIPSYDTESRNWCKKLWNVCPIGKLWKCLYEKANHVIKSYIMHNTRLYTNRTKKLWYFNIAADKQEWSNIQINDDTYVIYDFVMTSTHNDKEVVMHIYHMK